MHHDAPRDTTDDEIAAALRRLELERRLPALLHADEQPSAPLAEDELDDWDREMAPERVRRQRGGRFAGL